MNKSFALNVREYSIAAGVPMEVRGRSEFFSVMEAPAVLTVEFYYQYAIVGTAENVGQGFRVEVPGGFDGFRVTSATAQSVKLCTATGGNADLSQVVSVTGTVSVINGEMARVKSGQAFIGKCYKALVAGQYTYNQLLNPAGSGRNVFITKLSAIASAATRCSLQRYDTALSDTGEGITSNKLIGNAPPLAQMRGQSSATQLSPNSTNFQTLQLDAAYKSGNYEFNEPLLLPPGVGLIVGTLTVGLDLWVNAQWIEETI